MHTGTEHAVANLPLPPPDGLPIRAAPLHHRRPLRRTTHNPSTTYPASLLAPRPPYDTTALLRVWIGHTSMAEDRQLAAPDR